MRRLTIRPAHHHDLPAIRRLLAHTTRVSNTADYGAANVARMVWNMRVTGLARLLRTRRFLTAREGGRLVGVASLSPTGRIGHVFVDPSRQGRGVGRAPMDRLEAEARAGRIPALTVQSSLAGERFYLARGFRSEGQVWHGDERTIAMRRDLPPLGRPFS